jgi:hypothetical protein
LIITISDAVGLDMGKLTTFKMTVWENNDQGTLTLAKLEPDRTTPMSKHYAVRIHWFRSYLKPNQIEAETIHTDLQKADILTKSLRANKFEAIRYLLCGW